MDGEDICARSHSRTSRGICEIVVRIKGIVLYLWKYQSSCRRQTSCKGNAAFEASIDIRFMAERDEFLDSSKPEGGLKEDGWA